MFHFNFRQSNIIMNKIIFDSELNISREVWDRLNKTMFACKVGEKDRIAVELEELNRLLLACANEVLTNKILEYLSRKQQVLQVVIEVLRLDQRCYFAKINSLDAQIKNETMCNPENVDGCCYIQGCHDDEFDCAIDELVKIGFTNFSFINQFESLCFRIIDFASMDYVVRKYYHTDGEPGFAITEYQLTELLTGNNQKLKKITLITSMFNGEKYLESFIEDIVCSSFFNELELLIFDVSKNNNCLKILIKYLRHCKNIVYMRLNSDPGLYDIWNLGVFLSSAEVVGNANIDDRRHALQLEALYDYLVVNPDVFLASTHVIPMNDFLSDKNIQAKIVENHYFSWMSGEYSIEQMFDLDSNPVQSRCIPHCMPLWRKSLHSFFGYFNESLYKSAADYEFWLRSMHGGVRFHVVPIPASFYYINPESYMRQDDSHLHVAKKMYDIYIRDSDVMSENYIPDFNRLCRSISYRVN